MRALVKYLNSNRSLVVFTFANLADKGLVFLTPFVVLTLFHAKSQYVQLEYIISTVNIFAAFADLGMSGYMFYLYQGAKNKPEAVILSKTVSEFIFLALLGFCLLLLVFNYYVFTIHILLWYILSRILFIYLSVYFTSYFRLTDKPAYSIYISLCVNVLTLILVSAFYFLNLDFDLWLIFVPQLLLVMCYTIQVVINFNRELFSFNTMFNTLGGSLKFAWPSIVQVFLMMYMANYGKIHALDKLSKEDAVFLGYTLRICMIMQLAHATLVGFYAKAILAGEDKYLISKRIFSLYARVLLAAGITITCGLVVYQRFSGGQFSGIRSLMSVLFSLYTLLWCFYSYFEMYYARINRNRIKLYLTLIILVVFLTCLQFLQFNLLQNIACAMFFSILVGLLTNLLILNKLKFTLV